MSKRGMVHVYHGEGKGKTTASMGLAARAAGSGGRVLVVQFLKGRPSGEVEALSAIPGITFLRGKEIKKFTKDMSDEEKARTRALHQEMFQTAVASARAGGCDLLVLDEALGACATGLLDQDALLGFLRDKPEALEVVLTGRDPAPALLEAADYVTEMRKVKHPYDQGVPARKGVEY